MVMLSEPLDVRRGGASRASAGVRSPSLEIVDPCRFPGWNQTCQSHHDGSFFHSSEWMKVLAETYGFAPAYLVSPGTERPSAIIPVFEITVLGRRKGVSLPFSDFCEPLTWDSPVRREDLWHQLVEFGRARGWRRLELRGGHSLARQTPSIEFFGHVLDLTPGESKVFARLDPGVRQAIRKAEREGVTIDISTSAESVRDYYILHCQTRKRHGLPPQPVRLFWKLHEHVLTPGAGFVVRAALGGTPVAGAIFARFGERGLFKFGASDRGFQHVRANDLVMWSAIKELIRDGVRSLHFGRTSITNEGLRRFKLGWGSEEHRIQYLTYDFRQSAFVMDRDRAFGWHNRLFGAMPVWVARIAGSLLYKRLA